MIVLVIAVTLFLSGLQAFVVYVSPKIHFLFLALLFPIVQWHITSSSCFKQCFLKLDLGHYGLVSHQQS